jgi:hypothetical protein
MIWYVALVAILNICLGYSLAIYLGSDRGRSQSPYPAADSTANQAPEFDDGDEYYSEDNYDAEVEDTEYESAVTS